VRWALIVPGASFTTVQGKRESVAALKKAFAAGLLEGCHAATRSQGEAPVLARAASSYDVLGAAGRKLEAQPIPA